MKHIFRNGKYDIDKMLQEQGLHYRPDEISKLDVEFENLDSKKNIEEIKKIIIERREQRQRYLLEGLVTNGLQQTYIEETFDIILKEIEKQESIKHSVETKAGVMLAFYGVLLSSLMQSDLTSGFVQAAFNINKMNFYTVVLILIGAGWGLSSLLVILYAVKVFRCKDYATFLLDDGLLKAAANDKSISLVTLLETAFNVANQNLTLNNKKAKNINKLLCSIAVFAGVTFIFFVAALFYIK